MALIDRLKEEGVDLFLSGEKSYSDLARLLGCTLPYVRQVMLQDRRVYEEAVRYGWTPYMLEIWQQRMGWTNQVMGHMFNRTARTWVRVVTGAKPLPMDMRLRLNRIYEDPAHAAQAALAWAREHGRAD